MAPRTTEHHYFTAGIRGCNDDISPSRHKRLRQNVVFMRRVRVTRTGQIMTAHVDCVDWENKITRGYNSVVADLWNMFVPMSIPACPHIWNMDATKSSHLRFVKLEMNVYRFTKLLREHVGVVEEIHFATCKRL